MGACGSKEADNEYAMSAGPPPVPQLAQTAAGPMVLAPSATQPPPDRDLVSAHGPKAFHPKWGVARAAVSAEAGSGGHTPTSPKRGYATLGKALSSAAPPNSRVAKSPAEVAFIEQATHGCILFANLPPAQVSLVISAMWTRPVARGEVLIKQGDLGDFYYVVAEGGFDIFVAPKGRVGVEEGAKVASRGPGSSFGELALMYHAPRAATVRAVEESMVWAVDRATFRRAVTSAQESKLREYEEFLRGVQSFDVLHDNERARIAEALEEVTFPQGHSICSQGDPGDTLFIVKRGEVVVTKVSGGIEEELTRYHPGNLFGERALLKDEPRAATCTAVTEVVCVYLNREAFTVLLGSMEDIFKARVEGYALGSGISVASSSAHPASKGNGHQHAVVVAPAKPQPLELDRSIRKEDLKVVGTLGKGSFGHVQLVRYTAGGTTRTFALKTVAKAQVVALGQHEHILSEKNTMAALNHPFLIRLHATFQDKDALYFLLEVCLGGELFSVLRAKTHFDENTARFYAAGVLLAFQHMQENGYIYRDLKPENLLLDQQGYLKITDFGFAKKVGDARTWTLCGTPDYLAPEVVSGAGHGKGVDWWTLGILIYEMLASYPPFYDEDPMKTYAKIMHANPAYPIHFSRSAIDLIKGLLHPKPTKRLGVIAGGPQSIKNHAWFAGFDWAAFESKRMPAPIIMPIKSAEDLGNFEEYPDEDMAIPPYVPDAKNPNWDKEF